MSSFDITLYNKIPSIKGKKKTFKRQMRNEAIEKFKKEKKRPYINLNVLLNSRVHMKKDNVEDNILNLFMI